MFSRKASNPPPQPFDRSQPAPPGYGAAVLRVQNAPDSSYVLDNVVALPASRFKNGQYVIVNDQFVFSAR